MESDERKERLFTEFRPVATKDWESLILNDLKGADYEKRLLWKTREGITVKPFYRSEDLLNLEFLNTLPDEFPYTRGNKILSNDWHIRQDIIVDDIEMANKKALDILMKGITSLGFIINPKFEPSISEIEKLCENIYADAVELNFICYHNSFRVVQYVEKLVRKYNRDLEKIYGSVDFDPLGQYVLKGKFTVSEEASFDLAKQMIEAAKHLPNFRVINVNGSYFHNSGATLVETLALSLAQGVNYLTQLTEMGLSINEVAPRIKFHFAVGPNYFMEIAKFRAARLLWAHIVKAFGPCNESKAKMFIHAESSRWNKTVYDPYVNMLRTTTESMSAIIGGVDSMTVMPFDAVYNNPGEFSERIARNQQLLLKEESYLDKIADPAAGSYYIENLTASLAEQTWNLFLEIQEKGGFLAAFKSGYTQAKIKLSSLERNKAVAARQEILLGTNQYPHLSEFKTEFNGDFKSAEEQSQPEGAEVEILKPYRGANEFEKLRFATDRFAKNYTRPKVFLITIGNPAMRRTRAQFAGNFFGCAGYEIIDNLGFSSVREAADACLKSSAEIAVICSSDDEYAQFAPGLFGLLDGKTIVVVAGYPKSIVEDLKQKGIRHFIHMRSNVLETLKEFQKLLGIK
jgi:methylmalonyl-CoA mutase